LLRSRLVERLLDQKTGSTTVELVRELQSGFEVPNQFTTFLCGIYHQRPSSV
jgi:hypothetical protein